MFQGPTCERLRFQMHIFLILRLIEQVLLELSFWNGVCFHSNVRTGPFCFKSTRWRPLLTLSHPPRSLEHCCVNRFQFKLVAMSYLTSDKRIHDVSSQIFIKHLLCAKPVSTQVYRTVSHCKELQRTKNSRHCVAADGKYGAQLSDTLHRRGEVCVSFL